MRRTSPSIAHTVVLALLLSACPTPAGRSVAAPTVDGGSSRRAADTIGQGEIRSAPVLDTYDVVVRLRPDFLTRHAAVNSADPNEGRPAVYVDRILQGGVDMLRTVPAAVVIEVRYLTAAAASAEFSRYHPGGVIAVRTRP